jgi:2-polyprenyl-3-methyl-5-hydroxy-6-metoxy-1,4-benzoquinol methylase
MEIKPQNVCPWWLGYLLIIPLRKFYQNPESLLRSFVKTGMKTVDYGCAMGYFTLPLARLVGKFGQVYAIDIQEKMLSTMMQRAAKAGLDKIIKPLLVTHDTRFDELTAKIDFVLLFAMVHEVPDKKELFENVAAMTKPGGLVLFAEPRGHVTASAFESSVRLASDAGFEASDTLKVKGSHATVLRRK